jgi:hypothetical protein
MGDRWFFRSGPGNLILSCYRLAKFYGQPPGHFLNQPVSAIQRHLHWTDTLLAQIEPQDK